MKKYRLHLVGKLMTVWLVLGMLTGCTTGTEETIPSETMAISYDPMLLTEDSFTPDSGEHALRILFVNAGKADCAILQADEKTWLVDTGEDHSVPEILAALAYMETREIEGIFLTHTDKDHVGGFETIAKVYPVKGLYTSTIRENPVLYEKMAGDIPYTMLEPGQSVCIGTEGIYLDVLSPIRLYPDEENNNSLVLRLDYGAETVLFTGDIKAEGEADLLATGYDLDCTVLKVPYHGRKDGCSEALLTLCTPDSAIICSDQETDPDTAHKKVLTRLAAYGEIYRTEDSSLGWLAQIRSDGHTISDARITHTPTAQLRITEISREEQTITIENTGETTVVDGYYLYSDRGDEVFVFPTGTTLAAGEKLTIGCAGAVCDILWEGETSVWHKSKEDTAWLYDRWGNLLDKETCK